MQKKSMQVNFRNSVAYRLVKNTILSAIILGVICVGSYVLFDLESEKLRIEKNSLETVNMFVPQARQALYNFNNELADSVVDSIFRNPLIYKVRLIDGDNGVVAQREREPLHGYFSGVATWLFDKDAAYSLPVDQFQQKQRRLGRLEIFVDQYYVARQFLDRALLAMLFGVIYTVVLSLIFLLLFYFSVSRPLSMVVRWLSKVSPERPDLYHIEGIQYRDDEFSHFELAMNRVLQRLQASISKGKLVEAKLNYHKNNLQKMVQARTTELSELNRKFISERFQAKLSAMKAQQAHWEAEKANQDKTRFLAAASHDLRQPLHAMGLFMEALVPHIVDERGKLIHNNLKESLDTMKQLFNALLDLSKLEAGVLAPQVEDFPLQSLFKRLELVYLKQAEEKNLWLRIRFTDTLVSSDPYLLEQILGNLLSNAIKYTEEGGVLVCCRICKGGLRIEVRDTGIGIKKEDQTRIFEEFVQLHNPARDRSKGLGLDMAIVKRTSDLLGHKLSLKSEENRGTVFSLQLKKGVKELVKKTSKVSTLPMIDGKKVLILDDDPAILLGMKNLLESWQLQPVIAQTLEEAIRLTKASAQQPDLIISDLSLAENMTGIDAILQIQKELNSNVPGVLITGESSPERVKHVYNTPFPLLHKPVKPAQLRMVCRSILKEKDNLKT